MTSVDKMPQITNICITAQINCRLSVRKITNNTCNSVLQIKPFNRCIIRLRHPKTTVFIYPNGKLVCIGGKSISEGRLAIRRVARMVQKTGYPKVKLSHVEVQNIAASHDMKSKLNLKLLHAYLLQRNDVKSRFDLKIFPNLRLQCNDWHIKTKLIVSRNGKIVITGVKTEESINETFESFVSILGSFKQ